MDPDLLVRAACRALVLPPGGPLLVALAGLALLSRAPRTGRALTGLGLALLLGLSLPVVGDALTGSIERYPVLDPAHAPASDVIVVLSGGVRRTGAGADAATPLAETLERLACAARLARATGLPILVSGGAVATPVPEAFAMQRSLREDFGLEARWLEVHSRTTEENARDTAALLGTLALKRVILVTSAVHMRRALAEFHAAGLNPVPAPAAAGRDSAGGLRGWLPSSAALVRSQAALYEIAGELVAELRGRR